MTSLLVGAVANFVLDEIETVAALQQYGSVEEAKNELARLSERLSAYRRHMTVSEFRELRAEIVHHPAYVLALSFRERFLAGIFAGFVVTLSLVVSISITFRFFPRLRRPKKQIQNWAYGISCLPVMYIPICMAVIIFTQVGVTLETSWPVTLEVFWFEEELILRDYVLLLACHLFLLWDLVCLFRMLCIWNRIFHISLRKYFFVFLFSYVPIWLIFRSTGMDSRRAYFDIAAIASGLLKDFGL